jgi:TPR repeat protein
MYKFLVIIFCTVMVAACTPPTPKTMSELQQGQRLFNKGYYKDAMRDLLPLATDGNAEAQYAVGYMYYYGYGVAQDTNVGSFWIKRAAAQNYQPAITALGMLEKPSTVSHAGSGSANTQEKQSNAAAAY